MCANGDPDVAAVVRPRFPDAIIASVARSNPGAARNVLVQQARGDILLFIDDDVVVPPEMFARLGAIVAANPDDAVFGGPNDTPPGSTFFETVQGAVLASIVATGPVRRRYGAHPAGAGDERHFILCNLAVRRAAMLAFPPNLVCAEENALLAEMHERGMTMLYDPELAVFHDRRPTFVGFARQMHKYGVGRGQVLVRNRAASTPAFFVPSALVLYLVASPALVLLDRRLGLPVVAWLAATLGAAGRVGLSLRRRRLQGAALAAVLVPTIHLSYGVGVLRGAFKTKRPTATPEPRRPSVDASDDA